MNKFLASMPSTNTRIFVTLLVVAATAARYIASGAAIGQWHVDPWVPDWDWLLFLAAMSGLDLAQFHLKRTTEAEYVAAKQPQITASEATVTGDNPTVNAETVTTPSKPGE